MNSKVEKLVEKLFSLFKLKQEQEALSLLSELNRDNKDLLILALTTSDIFGNTPLCKAIELGSKKLADWILTALITNNKKELRYNTELRSVLGPTNVSEITSPLHLACGEVQGYGIPFLAKSNLEPIAIQILNILVDLDDNQETLKAMLNSRSRSKKIPLHLAIKSWSVNLVNHILKLVADLDDNQENLKAMLRTKDWKTEKSALPFAIECGNESIVTSILNAIMDLNDDKLTLFSILSDVKDIKTIEHIINILGTQCTKELINSSYTGKNLLSNYNREPQVQEFLASLGADVTLLGANTNNLRATYLNINEASDIESKRNFFQGAVHIVVATDELRDLILNDKKNENYRDKIIDLDTKLGIEDMLDSNTLPTPKFSIKNFTDELLSMINIYCLSVVDYLQFQETVRRLPFSGDKEVYKRAAIFLSKNPGADISAMTFEKKDTIDELPNKYKP